MKRIVFLCICLNLVILEGWAKPSVRVRSLRGDVRIRRGLEETWHPAGIGAVLEDIDTILTGEASEVVVTLDNGNAFTLSSQSILDIGDLRKITERELFLYLMSEKVRKIQKPEEGSTLRISNISVVRAEDKRKSSSESQNRTSQSDRWWWEINGAKALHIQAFHTNAILKFHKILEKYENLDDGGEIYFYLGKAFEAINEPGRAMDAYQQVLDQIGDSSHHGSRAREYVDSATEALRRLKK